MEITVSAAEEGRRTKQHHLQRGSEDHPWSHAGIRPAKEPSRVTVGGGPAAQTAVPAAGPGNQRSGGQGRPHRPDLGVEDSLEMRQHRNIALVS